MESNGKEGCIQITEVTYDLIKHDFTRDPQGTINVKGKGKRAIWHVRRKMEDSASASI